MHEADHGVATAPPPVKGKQVDRFEIRACSVDRKNPSKSSFRVRIGMAAAPALVVWHSDDLGVRWSI